jgi:hypothetical protein
MIGRSKWIQALSGVALFSAMMTAGGCSGSSATKMSGATASGEQMPAQMARPAGSHAATDPSGITECAECAGKGMAPRTKGEPKTVGGVQVVDVGIKSGYYLPNVFEVSSGLPVTVVFSGRATGCLAKPRFKELLESADFELTGKATIDLGTLAPGTYEWTCDRGMAGGQLIVK